MSYKLPYFVIDTETGGLPDKLKKQATTEVALTELAVVVLDNVTLKVIDKGSWLIKPYKEGLIYDPYAAKASGIDKKMCEEQGIDFEQAFKEFLELIKRNLKATKTKKGYLVGQKFIEFDLDFILNMFDYFLFDASEYFSTDFKDTMVFSRDKWPEENKHNLQVISERLGIPYVDAHRALADAEMTAKVFTEFMKLLRGETVKVEQPNQTKEEDVQPKKRAKFEL